MVQVICTFTQDERGVAPSEISSLQRLAETSCPSYKRIKIGAKSRCHSKIHQNFVEVHKHGSGILGKIIMTRFRAYPLTYRTFFEQFVSLSSCVLKKFGRLHTRIEMNLCKIQMKRFRATPKRRGGCVHVGEEVR